MKQLQQYITDSVTLALAEDLGLSAGQKIDPALDITASLIGEDISATATIITREDAVICGTAWVNEVFQQLDPATKVSWHLNDGDKAEANQVLCELKGNARILLTGERVALNFLQSLSSTATQTAIYVDAIKASETKLLDTRKTVPGLRLAQKYAVTCGGGKNHRIGLHDAYLIKENHIMACGGIKQAVTKAKQLSDKPVEVEVESLDELNQALKAGADIIMLDNFSVSDIKQAVADTKDQAKLEVSGNVSLQTIKTYSETGVDYISVGALTKHIQAVDLSMRINNHI